MVFPFNFNHNNLRLKLFRALSLTMVLLMLVPQSLMVAFAEGETPTDPPAVEETVTEEATEEAAPTEEATPTDEATEEAVTEESVPTDESAPADEATDEAIEAETEEIVEETVLEEDLTALVTALDEAGAVLLDEEGNPVAMGTEEAEAVLSSADPYYTLGGVIYGFVSGADCLSLAVTVDVCSSGLSNPIQSALDSLAGALPDDGTINIEDGSYDGFTVSGFNHPGEELIIQGSTGTPEIWGDIIITGNNVNLKLKNLYLDGNDTIDAYDNDGDLTLEDIEVDGWGYSSCSDGVSIKDQDGNVTITNVTSEDHCYDGFDIEEVSGNVTITDSLASENGGQGFDISDIEGRVTVTGTDSEDNGSDGFRIDNVDDDVTIEDSKAKHNDDDGFEVSDIWSGNLTITDSRAYGNGDDGFDIEEIDGNVTISETKAKWNDDDGFDLDDINGTVVLANLYAKGNDDAGATVAGVEGSVSISDSTFKGNDSDGIRIYDILGNVLISGSKSKYNEGEGFGVYGVDGNLTILDSVAKMNDGDGFDIEEIYGNVFISDSAAIGNYWGQGFDIYNVDSATIIDSFAGWNGGGGFYIEDVYANVFISGSKAYRNDDNGFTIIGVYDDLGDGSVTVVDTTSKKNEGSGFTLAGVAGNVTLSDVIASKNDQLGAVAFLIGGNVFVNNSEFEENYGPNLFVFLVGRNVTLNGVAANYSETGAGANINGIHGGVTVFSSQFIENSKSGLEIGGVTLDEEIGGNVLLDDVIAAGNGRFGAVVFGVPNGDLGVFHSQFIYNGRHGLLAIFGGDAYLYGVESIANGFSAGSWDGVNLVVGGSAFVCNSRFDDNDDDAVQVFSGDGFLYASGNTFTNTADLDYELLGGTIMAAAPDCDTHEGTTGNTEQIRLGGFPGGTYKIAHTVSVYFPESDLACFRGLITDLSAYREVVHNPLDIPLAWLDIFALPDTYFGDETYLQEDVLGQSPLSIFNIDLRGCQMSEDYTYKLTFTPPAELSAADLKLVYWVWGEGWVEVSGAIVDGMLVVETSLLGNFALIQK